ADADSLAQTRHTVGALSFDAYLRRLDTTASVRDFLTGWWAVTGGSDPSGGAAIDALAAVDEHGGLMGVPQTLRRAPQAGWDAIAEAMVAAAPTPGGLECRRRALGTRRRATAHASG